MLDIMIALVAGYIIGLILVRVMSCVIQYLYGIKTPDEIGAIAFSTAKPVSVSDPFHESAIAGFWNRCLGSFFKNAQSRKWLIGETSQVALITSFFTGIVVWHFGVTLTGLIALLCLYFLILLGFTDSRTGYLPDCLTYPFMAAGFLVNIKATFIPLYMSVTNAMAAYLVCYVANVLFRFVAGNDGMGQGDFKMIAAIGAWFGGICLIFIVIVASLLAIATALVRMFARRQHVDEYFPFGPYLAIAAVPFLLYGRILMQTLNDFS